MDLIRYMFGWIAPAYFVTQQSIPEPVTHKQIDFIKCKKRSDPGSDPGSEKIINRKNYEQKHKNTKKR